MKTVRWHVWASSIMKQRPFFNVERHLSSLHRYDLIERKRSDGIIMKNHSGYALACSPVLASSKFRRFQSSSSMVSESSRMTNLYGDPDETSDSLTGAVPDQILLKGYDVIVIGGGPAGVSGALQAALMGHSVLIVDYPKSKPDYRGVDAFFGGPTGLFSKALRDSAKQLDVIALRAQGLDDDVIWKQIQNKCLKLAMRNAEARVDTLKKYSVDYQHGAAKLVDAGKSVEITVNSGTESERVINVPGNKILLATGSKPIHLDSMPFDGIRIFDGDTINGLSFLPKSVAIAGGGIIAIEYARIFRKLGAEVTLIIREESAAFALDRMGMEAEIARLLVKDMIKEGIHTVCNTVVDEFKSIPRHLEKPVAMSLVSSQDSSIPMHGGELRADIFLAAIGRIPTLNLNGNKVEMLGLQDSNVEWDKYDGVKVDRKSFQTTNSRVFAVGDLIGSPALASTGAEQAKIATLFMLDPQVAEKRNFNDTFPVGIWTTPEIGYYGYTLDKALEEGYDAEEGIAPYESCLRGRVFAPQGMLKLVFEKNTGRVLGCHIIGEDACELIHFGMELVKNEESIFDLCNEVFTAVTYHELFKEAALDGDAKLDFGAAWSSIFQALTSDVMENNTNTANISGDVLRKMFDEIDSDNTGHLDAENLESMLQKLGCNVNKLFTEKLIRVADVDRSGTIEFEEFENIFKCMNSRLTYIQQHQQQSLQQRNNNRNTISHHLEH